MEAFITCIGRVGKPAALKKLFEKKDVPIISHRWLSPDKAVDLSCSCESVSGLRKLIDDKLGSFLQGNNVDWIVTPADGRRKKMLITDMDSTIIQNECIDEIADMLGMKDKVAKITEAAMNGKIDFASALRERVGMLQGLPVGALQEVYDHRVKLMPGAKALVATMRKNGAKCILVSGGFTFFTEKISASLGFHHHHANTLDIMESRLTGEVGHEIVDKTAKLKYLKHHMEHYQLSTEDILAIGDGANDIPMLESAGLGIAYRAKASVYAVIPNRIRFNDLTAVLYSQGYEDGEITEDK